MALLTEKITILITSLMPEEFLDLLLENGVSPLEVSKSRGLLCIRIFRSELKIAKVCVKRMRAASKLEILSGESYIKTAPLIKTRPGLFIGVVGFFLAVFLMNGFTWEIDVVGNEKITSAQICAVLSEFGIKSGAKPPVPEAIFDAERAIEDKFELVEAVLISADGTKVSVQISEVDKVISVAPNDPCNVIASRDGVIIDAKIIRGKFVSAKGSGIQKGGLLISGYYYKNGRNVSLHADGEIIARCEETKEFFVPYEKEIYTETGGIIERDFIEILTAKIPLEIPFLKQDGFKNAKFSEDTRKIYVGFKNLKIEMPFKKKTEIYAEITKKITYYDYPDANKALDSAVQNYRENFLNDCKIIEEIVENNATKDGLTRKVTFIFETDIAQKTPK